MRSFDRVIARQKHLNDLVVVVLRGQYQRSHVRRKLTFLFRPKERIVFRSSAFDDFFAGHVVRMLDDDFDDLGRTLHDHQRNCYRSL